MSVFKGIVEATSRQSVSKTDVWRHLNSCASTTLEKRMPFPGAFAQDTPLYTFYVRHAYLWNKLVSKKRKPNKMNEVEPRDKSQK